MRFCITPVTDLPGSDLPAARCVVVADEHRVEGAWHVFRRTATVMGAPRTVVCLRLPVREVLAVDRC